MKGGGGRQRHEGGGEGREGREKKEGRKKKRKAGRKKEKKGKKAKKRKKKLPLGWETNENIQWSPYTCNIS